MRRRPCDRILEQCSSFTEKRSEVLYSVAERHLIELKEECKCVGAQEAEGEVFLIPNGIGEILWFDAREFSKVSGVPLPFEPSPFQWTGGCVYKGQLFCFPRASNYLLGLDLNTKKALSFDLKTHYCKEHHYGGVLYENGTVYQPPRDNDHILSIDPVSKTARKIRLAPKWLHLRLRYCGSVLHPNGLIYFSARARRSHYEFDPLTERFRFMEEPIEAITFDACVAEDGSIYGFSAYEQGILHIDIEKNAVERVCRDIGCDGQMRRRNGLE